MDEFTHYVTEAKQFDSYYEFYQKYGRIYCPIQAPMVWEAKVKDDFDNFLRALEPHLLEEQLIKQYSHAIKISFMGVSLKIPYDAVAYNAFTDALNKIKREL